LKKHPQEKLGCAIQEQVLHERSGAARGKPSWGKNNPPTWSNSGSILTREKEAFFRGGNSPGRKKRQRVVIVACSGRVFHDEGGKIALRTYRLDPLLELKKCRRKKLWKRRGSRNLILQSQK